VAINQPVPLSAPRPAVRLVQGDVNAAALPIPSDIETGVHQDAVDPGRRSRLTAKSVAMRDGAEISLLHQIIDILAADEARRDAAQLAVGVDIRIGERFRHVIS
jgi:hypothetical protein